MKTARLCGISCILFLLWCGYITAQEKREVRQNARGTQAEQLSAEELFKQISPSVFVVESLDRSGQPIEQGSAVVIRVERFVPDSVGTRESARPSKQNGSTGRNDSASRENVPLPAPPPGYQVVPAPDQWQAPSQTPTDTFLVTNYHVVKDGVSFRVRHGEKVWPAGVVTFDASHDLAELKIKGLKAPAVTIRKSSTLLVGEPVYAIGAPEGLELTISQGLISGLRQLDSGLTIQTTAAISPGSSGGGLFDSQGRLVGITAAFLREGENLNFAIPAELSLSLDSSGTSRDPSKIASDAEDEKFDVFIGSAELKVGLEGGDISTFAFQQAAHYLQEAVQLNPDDSDAWMLVAMTYDELGQHENSMNAFRQSVRLKPDDEYAWQSLGGEYLTLGQNENALAAEQQAIALKPDDETAWVLLGSVYSNLGQYDKAVSAEQQAIALKADDDNAWALMGDAYFNLGQYKSTLWAEANALKRNPKNEVAWQVLGAVLDNLQQYDKAVTAEQRAVALDDSDAAAWFDLGMAYCGLGQRKEVIKVYQKLKTLDGKTAEDFFSRFVLPN